MKARNYSCQLDLPTKSYVRQKDRLRSKDGGGESLQFQQFPMGSAQAQLGGIFYRFEHNSKLSTPPITQNSQTAGHKSSLSSNETAIAILKAIRDAQNPSLVGLVGSSNITAPQKIEETVDQENATGPSWAYIFIGSLMIPVIITIIIIIVCYRRKRASQQNRAANSSDKYSGKKLTTVFALTSVQGTTETANVNTTMVPQENCMIESVYNQINDELYYTIDESDLESEIGFTTQSHSAPGINEDIVYIENAVLAEQDNEICTNREHCCTRNLATDLSHLTSNAEGSVISDEAAATSQLHVYYNLIGDGGSSVCDANSPSSKNPILKDEETIVYIHNPSHINGLN